MLSVLTNTTAMQALRARESSGRELAEVRARLATGLRVAGPKDDSAAYSISRSLKSEHVGWSAVFESLGRGRSIVSVASNGVREIADTLSLAREALVSLADAGADEARDALRQQVLALIARSDEYARQSTYMGVNLLTSSRAASPSPPPLPPPQPADFLLPDPVAPGSGVLTFTRDAGALAGRVILELSLGAGQSKVEIYQGGKRQAATTRNINSGGPARPASGNEVIGFDYDPADGQTLSFRFNETYAGSNGWSISDLRMVYPPSGGAATPAGVGATPDRQVLSSPRGDTVALETRALLSDSLSIGSLTTGSVDEALSALDSALSEVLSAGVYFGGLENRLAREQLFSVKLMSGLETGIGTLVDADLSRESARLTALRTREALGVASLGIANAYPRVLLQLFQPRSQGP